MLTQPNTRDEILNISVAKLDRLFMRKITVVLMNTNAAEIGRISL